MSADDALLFIDSNKYLDLYRTDKGRKLLAPLAEQVRYIFVTTLVVDEVQRNKISVAADFLGQKFRELKLQTFNVPDHLSGASAIHGKGILQQMGEIVQKIKKTNDEVDALALSIVEQISRSEDEVSKALDPIFAKAVRHSTEEIRRARDRRELGNPPGKISNPIGDQLTWEQILTHFKGKRRLWIISRDGDYGTAYDGKFFLNRFLYDELCMVASRPEVYLFEDLVEGIEHFVETTGVKAEKRLTPEEAQEIEREEKSLPDLVQNTEEVRRTMTEMAKLAQPSEDVRRMLAKLANPYSEEVQRTMAELAKLAQPSEDMRRMLTELTKPYAEMAMLAQPSEDVRRMFAELSNSYSEEVRRAMDGLAKLAQPSEDLRRKLTELTKPYSEEVHRGIAGLYKPLASTDPSPEVNQDEKDKQRPTSPPSTKKGGDAGNES